MFSTDYYVKNVQNLIPKIKLFRGQYVINTKSHPIHINELMFLHEIIGRNLNYVNSANSSSKSEVTLSNCSLQLSLTLTFLASPLPFAPLLAICSVG